ncbi:MAG: hypothetical protein U0797_11235 [Gemmataceae bacterium]
MAPRSAKMASTLRLFTRSGREPTFTTTLVEDSFTRPLRGLVDDGFLTMEYTGTRRVYTLTERGLHYLEGKRMARKKHTAKDEPAAAVAAPAKNGRAAARSAAVRPSTPPPPPVEAALAPRPKKPRSAPAVTPKLGASPLALGAAVTPLEVIRMMREVRDYADAHEGVDALLALIQRVEEIGRRFGGIDCVRESLQAIREFRSE